MNEEWDMVESREIVSSALAGRSDDLLALLMCKYFKQSRE